VRLSCAEIRHLFWQLVLVVERSATAILRWSWWRRWHQAWARYYHYCRRKDGAVARNGPSDEGVQAQQRAEGNVLDVVWGRLEPLLPPVRRVGHPYDYSRRLVLEAIVHVMETDCGWRNLPSHFPPWQTVYTHLSQWRQRGIWDTIWAGLTQPHPTNELQL
jgi:transposase